MTTANKVQELLLRQSLLLQQQQNITNELNSIGAELLQLTSEQQEQKPEPTVVEPAPTTKIDSLPQSKSKANARTAMANKGKSAAHKAESLDVPVATVRKVEKAKAAAKVQASDKPMDAAAMKKLAKELGVSFEGIKFTSSKAREAFRATLEQAQANHDAKVWKGLSVDRQAKLTKAPSVDPNRASARAIAI